MYMGEFLNNSQIDVMNIGLQNYGRECIRFFWVLGVDNPNISIHEFFNL